MGAKATITTLCKQEADLLECVTLSMLACVIVASTLCHWKSSDIVVALTGVVIFWYSGETRRLRELTAKQIKISIKPIITVRAMVGNSARFLNIGKSPALNISVDDIPRGDSLFKFGRKDVCKEGEDFGLPIEPTFRGQTIHQNRDTYTQAALEPNSLRGEDCYKIITTYNDIEGGKWQSVSTVSNKGFFFKEVREVK